MVDNCMADDHAQRPTTQLRNVQLAIRLARHTARGWDNAAIPDDISDVANLLHLGLEPTARLLRDIDDDGKYDLIWRNTANGDMNGWIMNGLSKASGGFIRNAQPQWAVVVP